MTDEQLQDIRARCAQATPGPWVWDRPDPKDGLAEHAWSTFLSSISNDFCPPDGNEENAVDRWPYPVLRCEGTPDPANIIDGAPEPNDADFIAYAREDVPALLAYVDFLRALLHDLKEDSTAYRRGLQDGVKQERERCLALAARLEDYHGELPEEVRDLLETIRSGMSANACLNCQGRGILFGLETRSPCPVCSGTGSACAEAGQQEGSEA